MKLKRLFSIPSFVAAFLPFAAAPLMAELPTSPLDGEFTTSTNEFVSAQSWKLVINSGGVWNIVGDLAQVNWSFENLDDRILTGTGTINIGSETEAGSLYITGQNPVSVENWSIYPVRFDGTVNVAKGGSFFYGGTYINRWGPIARIGTLNVNGGVVSIVSDTDNHSYFGIKNLAVRDGGTFESALNIQTVSGGVWDLHSGGLSTAKLRVVSGSMTLNLHAEDVLANVPVVSFDENTGTNFRINVSADNSIRTFELNGNAVLELAIEDGASLTVGNLITKSGSKGVAGAKIVFYDYRADAFLLENSDLSVEDNRLYIPSVDTFVDLEAYDGDGNLLEGEWSYEWNGTTGMLVLTVPEPAAAAAALGALALAFAAWRKRK